MKNIVFILVIILKMSVLQAQTLTLFMDVKTNKFGYKDKDGKIIIQAKYDYAKVFHKGIAKVNLGGKHFKGVFGGGFWGYIDLTGKEVIPLKYDVIGPYNNDKDFSEGITVVELDHKWGFVDSATGKEIDSLRYDKAFLFKDGMAQVKIDDKEGRIDKTGKPVIPIIYDEIQGFDPYKGIAAAKLNGKWGYIDKAGKQVIPFIYDYVDKFFISGQSKVKMGTETFYIDMKGKRVP